MRLFVIQLLENLVVLAVAFSVTAGMLFILDGAMSNTAAMGKIYLHSIIKPNTVYGIFGIFGVSYLLLGINSLFIIRKKELTAALKTY